MRSCVHIPLPDHQADELCEAPAHALSAVDTRRILPADLRAATSSFDWLRSHPVRELRLTDRNAEDLLAACDAVHFAIDAQRIDSAELAVSVATFRTFRMLVHLACSGAPAPAARLAMEAA